MMLSETFVLFSIIKKEELFEKYWLLQLQEKKKELSFQGKQARERPVGGWWLVVGCWLVVCVVTFVAVCRCSSQFSFF